MSGALRVALGEYDTGWHDPATSLARAGTLVADAARQGARLVVLPEMCTTGFTMDTAWAEPVEGGSVQALAALARAHGVHLIAGVSLREPTPAGERAFNTALVFGPDGALSGMYRKQRLFAYAGEHESFAAGGVPLTCAIEGLRVSPFVCYDLRFPELFREVARDTDAIVVIANWPVTRREHWLALLRARAIENQCWVVGVNRTGEAHGLTYRGDSVVFDPWGEQVAAAGGEGVTCADLDPGRVAEIRERFPFLRDR
ncbi:MAG TPA: carbon-nitrogen family hydrolase [Gemmatimonadaceae bacterium]